MEIKRDMDRSNMPQSFQQPEHTEYHLSVWTLASQNAAHLLATSIAEADSLPQTPPTSAPRDSAAEPHPLMVRQVNPHSQTLRTSPPSVQPSAPLHRSASVDSVQKPPENYFSADFTPRRSLLQRARQWVRKPAVAQKPAT